MRIAIIGSGLAGATAASILSSHHEVEVFEKSRASAGRMCTRRRSDASGVEYAFDHGAQYFTIKGDNFANALAPMMADGTVMPWDVPMVTISAEGAHQPRQTQAYVACPGMTALAKTFLNGVMVRHETEITAINAHQGKWRLSDKDNNSYDGFDRVITAIPAVQAAALMPAEFPHHQALHRTKMMACFTVMLGFAEEIPLPFGGAFVDESPIGFIAVNSSKPSRQGGFSLVVQANNSWAEPRVDDDPSHAEIALKQELMRLTDVDAAAAVVDSFHRWRYAATATPSATARLYDDGLGLYAIGDWCLAGRVEAAFDSGLAIGRHLSPQS